MVRKMSQERLALLDLLREQGPQTPATAAPLLGCTRKAAASLLYSCLDSGQVEALGDGLYGLPQDDTLAETMDDPAISMDVTEPSTESEECRIDMPLLGESPSGTWGYSAQDGGMVPREELRRRKGYSG